MKAKPFFFQSHSQKLPTFKQFLSSLLIYICLRNGSNESSSEVDLEFDDDLEPLLMPELQILQISCLYSASICIISSKSFSKSSLPHRLSMTNPLLTSLNNSDGFFASELLNCPNTKGSSQGRKRVCT